MKNKEVIFKALDLIEQNLRSEMTVLEISQKSEFSFYYFSRLFKGITGISPKTYMLNRKITESSNDILETDKKIIEIAFDYGFNTPESFSRSFQKITGINPSQLRKNRQLEKKKLLQPITKEKIEYRAKIPDQEPELVTVDSILLVGIPFYYDLKWKNDLSLQWEIFLNNISLIPDRIVPEKYYQLQYWFHDQDPDSIFFFIAAEVTSINEIPIQLTAKILPKQQYLKFYHKGFSNKIGYTYQYIYEKWLPETEYKLPYLYNFEHYGKEHKGPYNEESISEIYIPVKI